MKRDFDECYSNTGVQITSMFMLFGHFCVSR